jgi:hypothetical protein
LPLWLAVTHYGELDQSGNERAQARWQAILGEPLPNGAVLVSSNRNDIMPMWYYQYVDGERPDLLGLFPLITPEFPTLGHVLDLALSTARPVYLIKEMPGIEIKVDVERQGLLWRVLRLAAEQEPEYVRTLELGDGVMLAGYDRSPRSPRPGEPLQVDLLWEALHPLEAEYHSFVHLLDAQGQAVAQSDRQPGDVHYPTTTWRPGERLRDEHLLVVPADAAEGIYSLLAGMYAFSADGSLQPLGEPVIIGQVGVKSQMPPGPGDIGQPVAASLGGEIELLGYEATQEEGALAVTLHWRSLVPPDKDYTVFVHLLDTSDEVITQDDGQPLEGAYPTSVWDAGEMVADPHRLPLPADLVPGDYRLRVGLYLLETGQRLQVEGNGDSVELGPVELGD